MFPNGTGQNSAVPKQYQRRNVLFLKNRVADKKALKIKGSVEFSIRQIRRIIPREFDGQEKKTEEFGVKKKPNKVWRPEKIKSLRLNYAHRRQLRRRGCAPRHFTVREYASIICSNREKWRAQRRSELSFYAETRIGLLSGAKPSSKLSGSSAAQMPKVPKFSGFPPSTEFKLFRSVLPPLLRRPAHLVSFSQAKKVELHSYRPF